MSDNELYTYFKGRSDSFDEMPSDVLWAKIEGGLNNSPAASAKPIALFIKIGLAVLIAGIASVILLTTFSKQDIAIPVQTEDKIQTPPAIPSAKAIETDEVIAPAFNDTVKKKKGTTSSSTKKQPAIGTIAPNQPAYIKFKPVPNKTDSLITTPLKGTRPEPLTQIMPGRIVVTAGTISKEEFDELVQKTLETHKEAHGSLIIVKAPRQQTFRHKIPALPKPEPIPFKIISQDKRKDDSTKLNNPEYVKFLKVRDTVITPETIKFKPTQDTLPHPK